MENKENEFSWVDSLIRWTWVAIIFYYGFLIFQPFMMDYKDGIRLFPSAVGKDFVGANTGLVVPLTWLIFLVPILALIIKNILLSMENYLWAFLQSFLFMILNLVVLFYLNQFIRVSVGFSVSPGLGYHTAQIAVISLIIIDYTGIHKTVQRSLAAE